ncbi:MAG: ABC transporter substrate-binding protein [Labilithrix sp.]|nr:ABC transporter substrate-binding protein [Labilithrix sp.]MCW5813834.1 ABC transporter substrate-binding protein [Labilithrix sp.]
MARFSLRAAPLLLAAVASCTLTRSVPDSCTSTADCRAAFGGGLVCGASGLCERAGPNPRCEAAFPVDLLTRPESYAGIITLGSLMDRSVETQRDREAAIRLATMQVNEAKGLDGRLFGVVQCDVAEDAKYDSLKRGEAAVENAKYLSDVLGVPAIIGPSASGDALLVLEALKGKDVLVMSPSASSPELTTRDVAAPSDDEPGLFWRTVAPDTLQGNAIARQIVEVKADAKRVVVIAEEGPYGSSLAEVFTQAFAKDGRAANTIAYTTASERDAAIVAAAAAPPPDFVLFFSSQTPDVVSFLNAASTLESYKDVPLFLTDSAANTDVLNGVAAASTIFPRVTGSRPAVPKGPTFELFKTSYSAAFKKDPSALGFAPQAYDATWLVFYGTAFASKQGTITGKGIARGLRKIARTGPEVAITPANWTAISNDVAEGKPVNVDGASGKLDYDPATEETTSLVDIWKISADGKAIETIKEIDPTAP